ncbi:MFS transporter [Camelimonas abortus]|uniref:MFS transporter n=1 Tax=Camelimonas abortus TaxID=1017184 RepID=A0ABV7LET1_9HYPH
MTEASPPASGAPAPQAPPSSPVQEPLNLRALASAILLVSLVGVGLSLSIPLLSLEMERMGVSGGMIGLNTAMSGFASLLSMPFVPRLAAAIGVRAMIALSIAVTAATLLAFRGLPWLPAWFVLRFAFSSALGALFVLSEYWINAAAPPRRRGLVMGIYATCLSLGFAIGPVLLGYVGTSGWTPYLAGAALMCLGLAPLAQARGVTPELDHRSRHAIGHFLVAAPLATLAALVFGAVETGGFSLLPLYALRLGHDEAGAAFMSSFVALGGMLLQIPLGLLSDRMDRRTLLVLIALFGAASSALMPLAAQFPWGLEILLLFWGGVGGGLYTVGLAHLGARFTDRADLASANAAFILLYNLGMMLGPPVIGLGFDRIRPHGFAVTLTALFAAYAAFALARVALRRGAA